MSAKPNRKPWIIVGLLALFSCVACMALLYIGWNSIPDSGNQAGPPPQPKVAISAPNAKKVEKLYGFSQPGTISMLAWSPNSRLLASNRTVWDVTTGRELQSTPRFPYQLYDVAFSPDSQWVAYLTENGTRIWNVADGSPVQTIDELKRDGNRVTFSPDGRNIVATTNGGIEFWDVATGKKVRALDGYSGFAFAPDGRILAWSPAQTKPSRGLKLSDLETGRVLWLIDRQDAQRVFFSHNARIVAGQSGPVGAEYIGSSLTLLDATNGTGLRTWQNFRYGSCVDFAPDDTLIASTFLDPKAIFSSAKTGLWDVNGEKIAELDSGLGGYQCAAFAPDGRFLATSGMDTVQLWGIKP